MSNVLNLQSVSYYIRLYYYHIILDYTIIIILKKPSIFCKNTFILALDIFKKIIQFSISPLNINLEP